MAEFGKLSNLTEKTEQTFPARHRKGVKFTFYITILLVFAGTFFLALGNLLVCCQADDVYNDVSEIPVYEVGVFLGCSPVIGSRPNLFFRSRMNAAAELYHAGKVKKFILSGDNGSKGYNEPEAMRQALMERGVPDEVIYCDYAGFSTLDSVVRAKTIFGAEKYLVISQRFHSERAIFLARSNGIEAYGFAAEDIDLPYWKYKNRFRESLARAAALLDVITFRSPRFGGRMVDMDSPQERAL